MACILVSRVYLVKKYEGEEVMVANSVYIVILSLDLDRVFLEGEMMRIFLDFRLL